MTVYEERIDKDSDAALVAEHAARYRLARPAIAAADLWIDLGCGNGSAAAAALRADDVQQALLVDVDAGSVARAAACFAAASVETLRLDLSSADDLERLKQRADALLGSGRACVTCFEVIEHLDRFAPLLELLTELSAGGHTIVLSVPNDAFWSQHNPHHRTTWGGDAFEEFRGLLPSEHTVFHQVSLAGTAIQPVAPPQSVPAGEVALDGNAVPSHYLVVIGPHETEPEAIVSVVQADLAAQRSWERQRETDLAWLRQREADLVYYEAEAKRLQRELDELRASDDPR